MPRAATRKRATPSRRCCRSPPRTTTSWCRCAWPSATTISSATTPPARRCIPWLDRASRRAEARFFHLTATRELGEHAEYVRLADALATEFPADSWSEETLNNLATHYILVDDDASADADVPPSWPGSSPRAGTRRARPGRSAGTRTGRAAMPSAPRSSKARPAPFRDPTIVRRGSTGSARSRDQLGDARIANRLYGIIVADYRNSYYGRIAERALTSRQVEPMTMAASVAAPVGAQDAVRAASTGRPRAGLERGRDPQRSSPTRSTTTRWRKCNGRSRHPAIRRRCRRPSG